MEISERKQLRKKQTLYINILYLIYLLLVSLFLFIQASSLVVYITLGVIFLLSPISLLLMNRPNPLLLLFPGMKALMDDEFERLGPYGRKYHIAGMSLQLLLSGFCFFQAIIRGTVPFIEGIPLWYVLVVALVLIYVGNLNHRFHIRRFDHKSDQELHRYAQDQTLFTFIFATVFFVFVVVGALLVFVIFQ